MKVKVVKPGTLVWDAEQGVVVQDRPVQVRATGAIRDALNSKQIVEVFGDDEDSGANATIGSEADQSLPVDEAKPEQELPVDEAKPAEAVSADEAPKAKKLTIK